MGDVSADRTGRVQGKVVAITGAASGFGEATARLMAAEGAAVVLADLQDERGRAVADDLAEARYVHCDVTQEPDVAGLVDAAVSTFGRLDCIFNNAGIIGTMGPIDEIPLEEYEFTMAAFIGVTCLPGAMALTRMPHAPSSAAALRVKPTMPAFAVAYT